MEIAAVIFSEYDLQALENQWQKYLIDSSDDADISCFVAERKLYLNGLLYSFSLLCCRFHGNRRRFFFSELDLQALDNHW